jgi:outer membrane protein assembly factor BamB
LSLNNLLFIGIAGNVLALDRANGEEVWRSKLKGYEFVNVALLDGALYATAAGELFCLDPATGEFRWRNQLKGLGLGLISIAMSTGQSVTLEAEKQRIDAANDSASASTATQ